MQDEIKLLYAYFLAGDIRSIRYMSYGTWYLCKRVLPKYAGQETDILLGIINNKIWVDTDVGRIYSRISG